MNPLQKAVRWPWRLQVIALATFLSSSLYAVGHTPPTPACLLNADPQVIEGCSINSAPAPLGHIDLVFADLPVAQGVWVLFFAENYFGDACIDGITFNRTYTLLDDLNDNGQTDPGESTYSCMEQFIIADHEPPVFLYVPTDIIVECTPHLPEPIVDNPCGDIELFSTELGFLSPCNPDAPGYPRLWTAVDGCGNTTEVNQMLYVRDTKGPVLIGVPADTCAMPGLAPNVTAFDSCSNTFVPVVFNETSEVNACGLKLRRTWYAEDNCGNISTGFQTVSAPDTEPPVLFFSHPDLVGLGNGSLLSRECVNGQAPVYDETAVVVSDNCSDIDLVFERLQTGGGNCQEEGYLRKYRYRWTATDFCGNQSQLYFDLELTDTTPPVLIGVPENLHLYCGQNLPPMAYVTPVDNCGIEVFTTREVQFTLSPIYTSVLRQWKAVDSCGNKTVDVQAMLLENAILSANFQNTGPLSCGSSNNTVSATITGGHAPYGFVWSIISGDGAILSNPNMSQINIALGQEPFALGLEVFDINGCSQFFIHFIECTPPLYNTKPPATTYAIAVGDWSLFPNPASDGFWLNLAEAPQFAGGAQYTLLDMLGRNIQQGFLPAIIDDPQPFIPTLQIPSGVYWLRLSAEGVAPELRQVLLRQQ